MALKDTWIDIVDNVDEINASDINNVARAVIDIENEPKIVIDGMMLDASENPVQNKVIKTYIDDGYSLLSAQTTNLDSRIYQLADDIYHSAEFKNQKGVPYGYAPLDGANQIPNIHIASLLDRILNVETTKADISYVDNAISGAINEALEGDY